MKALDSKYNLDIREDAPVIVKTSTGEPLPDDEPLILFRARDRQALWILHDYKRRCILDGCNVQHIEGILERIDVFTRFAAMNPERMKQPGSRGGR